MQVEGVVVVGNPAGPTHTENIFASSAPPPRLVDPGVALALVLAQRANVHSLRFAHQVGAVL